MEKENWSFTGDMLKSDYGIIYRIQSNKDIDLKNGHVLIRELGGYIDFECDLQDAWLDKYSRAYSADIKDGTVIRSSEVYHVSLSNCLVENSHIVYDGNIVDAKIINSRIEGDGSIAITGEYTNKIVEVKQGRMEVKDRVEE